MHFENEYLVLDENDKIYDSKIFTSRFATLLGANDFQKKGDALLEMWKLIPKEPFDPFYTLRGEIAERIVESKLATKNVRYKYFGKDASDKKVFDLFPNNKYFGGVYDFVVNDNQGKYVNVEIKSTSEKNLSYLTEPRKEHVKQAQLCSYLGNLSFCKIIYVVFNEHDEQMIREKLNNAFLDIPIYDFKVKLITFDVEINEDQIRQDMKSAYDYVNKCKITRKIPISDLSDKVLSKLNYAPDIFERTKVDYD